MGTLTTPVIRNNTGTVLANETGVALNVYNPTTGALVVRLTGLTTNASGVLTATNPSIVSGTTYNYEVVLSSNRRRLPVEVATGGSSGGDTYSVDFTSLTANESPISLGGVWTNDVQGTGGNFAATPNTSMQIRLSADGTTRICCETGATNDYDDAFSVVPGFPGNQRVEATVYRQAGYAPSDAIPQVNHEIEIFVGTVVNSDGGKRGVEIGINDAGDWFVATFDGSLTSWQTWGLTYEAEVSEADPLDGDVIRVELDRTAKTIKAWQNDILRINLNWNTTTAQVTPALQTVLNNLGDSAGFGGLRRIGAAAVEGAFGWRDILISSTLLG